MKILETRLYQHIDLLVLRYPQLAVTRDCIVEAYRILEEAYTCLLYTSIITDLPVLREVYSELPVSFFKEGDVNALAELLMLKLQLNTRCV